MITLISPAKNLNYKEPANTETFSEPSFQEESAYLIGKLKKMSGIMGTTVKTMLELVEKKIDEGGVIDCNEVFQRLTLDTIGKGSLHKK